MSRDRLHVVILSAYMRFPVGMAATNRARLLARALEEAGVAVRVVTMQASERPPHVENTAVRGEYRGIPFEYSSGTTVRNDSFPVRRAIAARGWLQGAARLVELRRRNELDVVYKWHLGWPRDAYVALLNGMGVPIVSELNEHPSAVKGLRTPTQRLHSSLLGVSGVVAISRMLEDWILEEARRLKRTVEVIPVPIVVDVDEQHPTPYPAGDPLVVFAGAPEYDDTIRFIFAAMERVWEESPDCRLVVTGANPSDPAARWLLGEARARKAEPRVEIAGYLGREDLLRLYGRAHALLIPLFDDARSTARFPTKIGEYLAAARPVVSSAVGEIPRYFEDDRNGVICPPGDATAYGDRIVRLLRDPAKAAAIGLEGRALAERVFHYARYAETLRTGFERVARRPAVVR